MSEAQTRNTITEGGRSSLAEPVSAATCTPRRAHASLASRTAGGARARRPLLGCAARCARRTAGGAARAFTCAGPPGSAARRQAWQRILARAAANAPPAARRPPPAVPPLGDCRWPSAPLLTPRPAQKTAGAESQPLPGRSAGAVEDRLVSDGCRCCCSCCARVSGRPGRLPARRPAERVHGAGRVAARTASAASRLRPALLLPPRPNSVCVDVSTGDEWMDSLLVPTLRPSRRRRPLTAAPLGSAAADLLGLPSSSDSGSGGAPFRASSGLDADV